MGPKGVIFDMDGVLVDSYQAHLESWQRSAAARGLDMTEEQFAQTFGRTSREIIRHQWPEWSDNEQEILQWDHHKEEIYREIITQRFPEMDGAGDLLAALDEAGFKLAIGSSGPPENVAAVVKVLPNASRFSAQVTGRDVTHGKPHPEVFLKAADKLGLQPDRCLVMEDAPPGVQAAKAAGMKVIAITGTAPREKLTAADAIVDSLREVSPEMVKALICKGN